MGYELVTFPLALSLSVCVSLFTIRSLMLLVVAAVPGRHRRRCRANPAVSVLVDRSTLGTSISWHGSAGRGLRVCRRSQSWCQTLAAGQVEKQEGVMLGVGGGIGKFRRCLSAMGGRGRARTRRAIGDDLPGSRGTPSGGPAQFLERLGQASCVHLRLLTLMPNDSGI